MSSKYHFLLVGFFLFLFLSCDPPGQKELRKKLVRIDSLLMESPQMADDSLKEMSEYELSDENRAYYGLLDVIARHKLYKPITSDSLISAATKELKVFPPDKNYFRSLVYEGMVRYGIESIPDSLVLLSLKKAEQILNQVELKDEQKVKIKLFFFLGLVHQDNKNYEIGEQYFEKALEVSKSINDVDNIVSVSISLFWSYLVSQRFEEADAIICDLEALEDLSPELRFDIVNAQAGYNLKSRNYSEALSGYIKLDSLANKVQEKPRMSNVYYSMFYAYRGLEEMDSALVYAEKAVESIEGADLKYDNFYMYIDFADVAFRKGKNRVAAINYKKAFEELWDSTNEKAKKRILELEKQYDLSQANVEALKQRQKFQRFVFIVGVVLLALAFVFLIYHLNLKKSRLELENERILRESAEKEAEGTIQQNKHREHLLKFYKLMTQREMVTQERFDLLSQKYIKEAPKAYNDLQTELITLKEEFSGMMYDLMNDELFYSNLELPEDFHLTDSEKVMLFLMSYRMPSTEIATVLGISANNFRVRKSNLKKRLVDTMGNSHSVEKVISLF